MIRSNLPRTKATAHRRSRPKQRAAKRAPEAREGALDGRQIGELVHVVIGDLLAAGVRRPNPEQLFTHVARHPLLKQATVYRQAARQRLATAASLYFRFFAPPAAWRFEGAEVRARTTRFDLVWSLPSGEFVIDEIKTGRITDPGEHERLLAQVEGIKAAARAEYGDLFLGVRVLVLAAPRISYFAQVDGQDRPLKRGEMNR